MSDTSVLERKATELRTILELDAEQIAEINAIGERVTKAYTLADAIREGAMVTEQAYGWLEGEKACALTSAVIAAKARGFM